MIDIVKLVDDFNSGKSVALMGVIYSNKVVGDQWSFNQSVRSYLKKGLVKSISVPMRTHQDYIGNKDIDELGYFTVGRGKVRYHSFTWWSTGSCTIQPIEWHSKKHSPRFISGNEIITIHFAI